MPRDFDYGSDLAQLIFAAHHVGRRGRAKEGGDHWRRLWLWHSWAGLTSGGCFQVGLIPICQTECRSQQGNSHLMGTPPDAAL